MSAASERALDAALGVAHEGPLNACNQGTDTCDTREPLRHALAAAHDPALGLDRSVRLGDVVDTLRRRGHPITGSVYEAAALIEREFTGAIEE